jgi:hypothetical protein
MPIGKGKTRTQAAAVDFSGTLDVQRRSGIFSTNAELAGHDHIIVFQNDVSHSILLVAS